MSLESEFKKLEKTLIEKKLTLSLAESATGGMISNFIVSHEGSSEYYLGSIVSYSNESKMKLLNLPLEILKEHGAVSSDTAKFMAVGALESFDSTIAASITGIAGPSGGSNEKPVGLTYISVCDKENQIVEKIEFDGERNNIRESMTLEVLRLLIKFIEENYEI